MTDTCKNNVSKFGLPFGSLLNHLYRDGNENVSLRHLS